MGSDHAPHVEIDGALAAARDFGIGVILVGQTEKVEPELRRCGWRRDGDKGIELVEAAEVIGMDDPVMISVRRKKKSSLRIGTKIVTEGRADGFVSAGNTGAAMATAKMVIGMLPGVDRPALAALIPTKSHKPTLLLDVGANSECKAHHLVQFAIMGDAYSRAVLGTIKPAVGLMSIGEEEAKGNDLTKEAFPLLRDSSLNFVGNVEGRDLFSGSVDVIVTDGFTGNVMLKLSEGLTDAMLSMIKRELTASAVTKAGAMLAKPAFKNIKPTVYPNPIQKEFHLQFPADCKGKYYLQMIDLVGRIYELGTVVLQHGGSVTVNISKMSLNSGLYFLRIHSESKLTSVFKLLIQY